MRENAELDLRVVRAHDAMTLGRDERRAHETPDLLANGDVLEVRIGRAEPPRRGDCLLEPRVDAPGLRVHRARKRLEVRPLQLVELAELEDDARKGMFVGELLENGGVRGSTALHR